MLHRLGIIGAGDVVARSYLPILSKRSDCKISAICSERGKTAKTLGTDYGINVYEHHEAIFAQESIDTVFICVPNHRHRQIAEAAIDHRKNVLLEKPVCHTWGDSEALFKKAENYKKCFYIACNNLHRAENQWLVNRALSNELGAIELIDFEWFRSKKHTQKEWLYDINRSGGGVLIDLGYHLIYMALKIVQNPLTFSVFCHNTRHASASSSVEDLTTAMIQINGTVSIMIKTGWDVPSATSPQVRLNVMGDQGMVSNHDYKGTKTNGYPEMFDDFFQLIESEATHDLSIAAKTMRVIDAMYQSHHEQQWISKEF